MAESRQEQIERLLREGLDLYGLDEISQAIVTWQKVLELEPDNVEARDYIKTADRRTRPRPVRNVAAASAILQDVRPLLLGNDFVSALGLLRSSAPPPEPALEFEATVELTRSRLHRAYLERVGDLTRVPRLLAEPGALKSYNLPHEAGFLVSLIDGMTPVEDLISVSGMDPFETLHVLTGLLDASIVELTI